MQTELGFELFGRFRMRNDAPPGLEGGQAIDVYFGAVAVRCTVTKAVVDGGDRSISFATPPVLRIEPVPAPSPLPPAGQPS